MSENKVITTSDVPMPADKPPLPKRKGYKTVVLNPEKIETTDGSGNRRPSNSDGS